MAKIALLLKGLDILMILKYQPKTGGDRKQTVKLGTHVTNGGLQIIIRLQVTL